MCDHLIVSCILVSIFWCIMLNEVVVTFVSCISQLNTKTFKILQMSFSVKLGRISNHLIPMYVNKSTHQPPQIMGDLPKMPEK